MFLPIFDTLAEKRILEAIARGDLSNLPGAGRPLALDDDSLVPPELRMAYRILKNAGLAPAEVLQRKEIAALEALAAHSGEMAERVKALQKIALLRARLGARRSSMVVLHSEYVPKILEKLAGA